MDNGLLAVRCLCFAFAAMICTVLLSWPTTVSAEPKALIMKPFEQLSDESKECAACHKEKNPSIYAQWGRSKHYGANVGCYECHKAEPGDKDLITHEGVDISVIVSPKDCSQCHNQEVDQFSKSHHAKAGQIIGSLDNFLAEVVEGALTMNGQSPAAVNGCWQCHGSEVKVLENGDLDPTTWPNTGIGRLNPDGSVGACTACHQRHEFDMVQARRPEACGKCHLGPDHPQKEVYEESKHGILYRAFEDNLNMDKPKWVAGQDYYDAPTCATCHMSATPNQSVTHDVGTRLAWNLRAPVSKRTENWEQKLADMQDVCSACHSSSFVEGFYKQLDSFVALYNDKFAIPAKEIREILMEKEVISKGNFDDKIDWIYWELWHHEGRRARHGAAMSGPDYAWWHGIYDVAKHFYTELLPETKDACEKAGKPEVYEEIIAKYIDGRKEHEWYTKGFDPKKVEETKAYYKERYQQDVK